MRGWRGHMNGWRGHMKGGRQGEGESPNDRPHEREATREWEAREGGQMMSNSTSSHAYILCLVSVMQWFT